MVNFKYLIVSFLFIIGASIPEKKIIGEVEYVVSLRTPDLNAMEKNKNFSGDVKEKMKDLYHRAQNVTATLYFNKNESVYKLQESLEKEGMKMNITKIFAGNNNTYYYDRLSNQNTMETNSLGKLFLVTSPTPRWELTKETKILGKYMCRKAILQTKKGENSNVIAWFTSELPVNHGPMNYNNLPGLILELQTPKLNIKATKIKLNDNIPEIQMPTEGEMVSQREFQEIARKTIPGFFKN